MAEVAPFLSLLQEKYSSLKIEEVMEEWIIVSR